MPKLSIITINYNNASGLQKTMESVFAQTFTDYEYIIIDGGSDDGSIDIIKEYVGKLARWVSEEDNGPYDAMNKGLKMATGLYIQFLNSGDSFAAKNSLEQCFEHSHKNDLGIIYGQINAFWGDGIKAIGYPSPLTLGFLKQYNINHQASFYKRELLTALNGFNLRYTLAADYALLLECVMLKAVFSYVAFPIVNYDMGGISTGRMKDYITEMEKAWKAIVPESINLDLKELQSLKIKESGRAKTFFKSLYSKMSGKKKEEAVLHFPERLLDY